MAWVRIHDGAMQHPKVLALSDSAFRLWVKSLMYCQTQLTDGLIPCAALKDMKAKRGDVERLSASIAEGYAPLWESIEGFGFKVHDYLFWNDSREKVRERQIKSKKRLDDWRVKHEAAKNAVTHTVTNGVSNGVSNATLTKPNQTKPKKEQKEPEPPPAARSRRPIFAGSRVTVFEWMFDDLCKLLGPHTDAFDLHEWFFALDAQCLLNHVIPPDRDNGAWLKQQCLLEAQRRGLPLRVASVGVGADAELAALIAKGPSVRPQ